MMVTMTAAEVVELPATSVAAAVKVCWVKDALRVFQGRAGVGSQRRGVHGAGPRSGHDHLESGRASQWC